MIMVENINIVEILKDKPQGTKLYSSACGKCKLEEVDDKSFKISFYNSKFGFMNGGEGYLDKNGKLYDDGECVVFPSKEMRDWRKFAWKKGDVLVSNDGKVKVIFDKFRSNTYLSFIGKYHIDSLECNNPYYQQEGEYATGNFKLEEVDAAQTYINTIEERLGGKLNRETLEVEKAQPEFKDGDIVVYGKSVAICRKIYKHTHCFYVSIDETFGLLFDYNTVSSEECRFAKEEEKQQFFDALAKDGKVWDAEKKEVVDLKPKWTPKPFDKIVAFRELYEEWVCDMFSHYSKNYEDKEIIVTIGGCTYFKALPFNEETAKLIGTKNNMEG